MRVCTISKQMQESTSVRLGELDSVKCKADSAMKIFQKLIKSPQESSGLKPIGSCTYRFIRPLLLKQMLVWYDIGDGTQKHTSRFQKRRKSTGNRQILIKP